MNTDFLRVILEIKLKKKAFCIKPYVLSAEYINIKNENLVNK